MINKIYNLFSKNIIISIFAFAVMALPGAGIAHTNDADIEAEAEAEISSSNDVHVETIELEVGVRESFTLETPQAEDGSDARSFTWVQVGGPFRFDMSTEDLDSLVPPEPGTYEFELRAEEDGREYIDRRVSVFVSATNVSDGENAVDPDDDGDGVPAGSERGITKEIDKTTPKLYQGVSLSGQLCARSEDCDDDSSESAQQLRVRVSGSEVRGWSEEQKAQVRERLQVAGEVTGANDFGIKVASAALDNGDIVEISSDDEKTEIQYKTTIKLFGFIPVNSTAVAYAEAGGEASVDYPWYAFLAGKPDHSAMVSLVQEIRTSHDVMISVEEEGAPINRRDDSEENSE